MGRRGARRERVDVSGCFLCADLCIAPELKPRADHASYLQSWLSVLAKDKRATFQAAAHALRAVLQPEADEKAAA